MKTISNITKTILAVLVLLTTSIVNAQTQERVYMGLRLPQMSNADRESIGVRDFPQHAKGQMIFNTETDFVQYWDGDRWIQLESKEEILNHIVNNFSTELGPELIEFITNNINNGDLGDVIIQYIITNIDQHFTDAVMDNVIITSMNNLLTVTKIGSSEFRLEVDIDLIMNQLLNKEEFITKLFENNHFTENLENFIENFVLTEEFITSITNLIDLNDEHLAQVLKHIQDNRLTLVNQEFTNEVMSNVTYTSLDNSVDIETTATSTGYTVDFSVNAATVMDDVIIKSEDGTVIINRSESNIIDLSVVIPPSTTVSGARGIEINQTDANYEVALPQGQKNDQIMIWNDDRWVVSDQLSRVRQITIPVENGTFSTEHLTFYGNTTSGTNLRVVSVEPVFSNLLSLAARRQFLNVSTNAQVLNNVIEWTVEIKNANFNPATTMTLASVVISYISDSPADISPDQQSRFKWVGF